MAETVTCEITYIHHDCFFIRVAAPEGARTLLFDYPAPSHLPDAAAKAAAPYFDAVDLTVFITHSHADHFGPQVIEMARAAHRVEWIVSYDVAEMHPAFEEMDNVHVAEPDEPFTVRDMAVMPVESTDLGVGYLLEWLGRRLFFAGDVAEWDWGQGDDASRVFAREFYGTSLAPLRTAPIDIAFHNADARLANWAGGVRFAREIAPRFFVPMHAFGDLASLARFAAQARDEGVAEETDIVLFERPGDTRSMEV